MSVSKSQSHVLTILATFESAARVLFGSDSGPRNNLNFRDSHGSCVKWLQLTLVNVVVSLGLQVYGTLKQYLDDFNSRDERVAKTLAYLAQLKEALNVVEAATQSLQAQHQAPSDMVLSCLRSCLAEMNALQGKLQEVGPSQQINVKEKIKEIKKKFKYPFQISSIEEIEKSLERIIGQLLLAIHGLEL